MELKDLEKSVRGHRRGAVAFVAIVLLAYATRFFFDPNTCVSPAAEPWGQFGDFVGGLLNPVIAFLAFYWLTQSVLIQKTELNDTKQALLDSANSQASQVILAERTARINALGSILDAKNAEIAHMRQAFSSMAQGRNERGWANTPEGQWIGNAQLQDYIAKYLEDLKNVEREQRELVAALQATIQSAA